MSPAKRECLSGLQAVSQSTLSDTWNLGALKGMELRRQREHPKKWIS